MTTPRALAIGAAPGRVAWRRATAAVVSACVLGGCESGTGPVGDGGVTADATARRVEIVNGTSRPVFTFVVGRNASALVDWFPCVDDRACPPIPPRRRRATALASAIVPPTEREVLVYWWHAVRLPNGTAVPDSIRWLVVPRP